jgi:hypothetical protein
MKYKSLTLAAEAFIDKSLLDGSHLITLRLNDENFCINQDGVDHRGDYREHEIVVHSKDQALSILRAISAMSAALGWKV